VRCLVLGGTRFLGPPLVRRLVEQCHTVAVFHRGESQADLPPGVCRFRGDRGNLPDYAGEFRRFAPQVVVDLIAFTEKEAATAVQVFRGIAQRLVVISSMDVYRAYDRLRRVDPGPPDPLPLTEDAPLRRRLYPYRAQVKGPGEFGYAYEKILVEQAVLAQPDPQGTVLRLPCIYGPGDYQYRTWEYLKRMDDGRPVILMGEQRASWRWTRGFVENMAAAISLAASDERSAGQVYNVGEVRAVTEADWVRRIGRAAGWQGQLVIVPEEQLPSHLRTPFDWSHALVGDIGKLGRELGYAEPVPVEEAMLCTVAWQRSHPPAAVDGKLFDYAAEDQALVSLSRSR
jgi:nucleoside-diphosphate-sugar epimerase